MDAIISERLRYDQLLYLRMYIASFDPEYASEKYFCEQSLEARRQVLPGNVQFNLLNS